MASRWDSGQLDRRRRLTVAIALASCLAVIVGVPSAAGADHGTEAARRAAEEIQDARDRADAAAQELFDTESTIDQLDLEIDATEEELAVLEQTVAEMRESRTQAAVRRFVGGGGAGGGPLLLTDVGGLNDRLASDVLFAVANDAMHVDVDDFDAQIDEMTTVWDRLDDQLEEAEQQRTSYQELLTVAETEIERLAEIEAQRLQDEQVEHELEAIRQAEQEAARQEAEREEAARQSAFAATASMPTEPAAAGGAASAAAAPASPASAVPASTGVPLPEPAAAASVPSTAAPEPAEPPPSPAVGGGLVCPIAGPRSFADTWGAARSGGRSHEGVDMMSPGGTPLVAMESGRVEFRTNNLGGNTVRLYGASGTRYYYAHLSAWEGRNRSVAQGEVIGYVGRTGNTQANHLHLQVHPGGGLAVNPYPYARQACG